MSQPAPSASVARSFRSLACRAMRFGLLMVAWSLAAPPLFAETAARIGTLEVSTEELRQLLTGLEKKQLESVQQDPALLEQLVRSLLVQKLVLKEASAQKWEEQPAVVARLARTRDSTLTETFLESVSEPPADYPSETELTEAYEAGRESFKQPRSFRLAQIFIAEAPEAETRLKEIRSLLKAPQADFGKIARSHSQEAVSAARDGEIGWVAEAQIEPELRNQVTDLKLFAISEPVRLKDGWHILKLLDAREAYTPTLVQLRPQLIKQLRQEKQRSYAQAYLARLLKEHPLVLENSALSRLLPAAAP